MIIFLYGSDSYRLKQAKNDIVGRYQAKYTSGVNLFSFDFSEINDLSGIDDAIRTSSFFNEHRLIICRNLFSSKPTADKMILYLKDQKISNYPDATLVAIENLSEKDLTLKHKELFKLLSNRDNTVKIINSLEGVDLAEWIKNEFQARGCSIRNEALKKIIEIADNTSWGLINEINKLANYQNGGEVKSEHINLLASRTIEANIFDLIDAIAQKNKPKAYSLLYQELKSSRDPYYILTMIIYQFRNLLTIKDLQKRNCSESEISKKAKIHPFTTKKISNSSKNFTIEELKSTYQHLSLLDIRSKNGLINLKDQLCQFILN